VRTARRVGRSQRAKQESQREEERESAALQRAGLPPKEPSQAVLHEAHAILLDSLWAAICPVMAPLLSSLAPSEEGPPSSDELSEEQLTPVRPESPLSPEPVPDALPQEEPQPIALVSSGAEVARSLSNRRSSQDNIVAKLEKRLSNSSIAHVSRQPSLEKSASPRVLPVAQEERYIPALAAVNMSFPGGFGGGLMGGGAPLHVPSSQETTVMPMGGGLGELRNAGQPTAQMVC
jgi:hypothetical protein